ncbi:ras-related protein Rab-21-like isoform X2 [Macrobrachium nipponense]|uniref:ras-related protein Rab-21-like isoform X2 n=1 Tax=Macrobrachium nipponense TaxID=159736 RepID=UPI0030C8CCBC
MKCNYTLVSLRKLGSDNISSPRFCEWQRLATHHGQQNRICVGKTSLVTRYESRTFHQNTSTTIGASFSNIELLLNDYKIKMQVWDTAGQERFRSMAPMYYRGANAALLVFDLSSETSFDDIKGWVEELGCRVGDGLLLMLVGNKKDLHEQRKVDKTAAQQYASSIGATYIETSALDNTGVEDVFSILAEDMVKLAESDENSTLRLYSANGKGQWDTSKVSLNESQTPPAKSSSSCCS